MLAELRNYLPAFGWSCSSVLPVPSSKVIGGEGAGCGWRKEQEAKAQRAAYPLTLTGVHTSWGGKAKGHRLHRAGCDTD